MTTVTIETGSNARTTYFSQGKWKGQDVWVTDSDCECIEGHDLQVIHHNGPDDKHYCPTTFLMCHMCGGLATEPEPYECTRWGE